MGQGRGDVNYNESDLLVRLSETKWESFFLFNLFLSLPQIPQTSRENLGFPGGATGKEPACRCRRHKRHGFDPWVGSIPRRRAWQPTPVFLPGESYRQEPGRLQSMGSHRVRHDWSNLACKHARENLCPWIFCSVMLWGLTLPGMGGASL